MPSSWRCLGHAKGVVAQNDPINLFLLAYNICSKSTLFFLFANFYLSLLIPLMIFVDCSWFWRRSFQGVLLQGFHKFVHNYFPLHWNGPFMIPYGHLCMFRKYIDRKGYLIMGILETRIIQSVCQVVKIIYLGIGYDTMYYN